MIDHASARQHGHPCQTDSAPPMKTANLPLQCCAPDPIPLRPGYPQQSHLHRILRSKPSTFIDSQASPHRHILAKVSQGHPTADAAEPTKKTTSRGAPHCYIAGYHSTQPVHFNALLVTSRFSHCYSTACRSSAGRRARGVTLLWRHDGFIKGSGDVTALQRRLAQKGRLPFKRLSRPAQHARPRL